MLNSAATIEKIYFDDETMCSSRVVFATLRLPTGETQRIQMVRETHPTTMGDFDDFWRESMKKGVKNLVGLCVELIHHPEYGEFGYNTIRWPSEA
ncbi:MAG: hypothetical protein IJ629_04705 [Clostridia bacterium]|nr:hypothetical protein [Clostridia bacterium]